MPRLFSILGYSVYFWSNESVPLEPVHVHVSKGAANPNATKVWIKKDGSVIIENNNSRIPQKVLNTICKALEANADEIVTSWIQYFGSITYK